MVRFDWQGELRRLGHDVLHVLFVYVLVLQALLPLSEARAAADDPLVMRHSLCSVLLPVDAGQPADRPEKTSHACIICCINASTAMLPAPAPAAPLRSAAAMLLHVREATPQAYAAILRYRPPPRAPPLLG